MIFDLKIKSVKTDTLKLNQAKGQRLSANF